MSNATINRILRILFGGGLIITTMTVGTAPLGGFAVLPLIAIPVILSGIYGANPIGELLNRPAEKIMSAIANATAKVFKRPTIAA